MDKRKSELEFSLPPIPWPSFQKLPYFFQVMGERPVGFDGCHV